jgi:hypothetical protein
MSRTSALLGVLLAGGLTVLPPTATSTAKPSSRKELTGTAALIQDELRVLFKTWDLNKDGFLDKEELAKAFRGPKAKPYDYQPGTLGDKKPDDKKGPAKDYSKYPDFTFLAALDVNGDDKISRAEFEKWAYDYALHLNKIIDLEDKIRAAELRLQTQALSAATRTRLEGTLQNQRDQKRLLAQQAGAHLDVVQKEIRKRLGK